MAISKAEMEAHWAQYHALIEDARRSQRQGLYRKAIQIALSSWEHIDGMIQYARRYQKEEFESVEAIDIVLRYAPLLLDFESLDRLDSLLKSQRRIERGTSAEMGEKLTQARAVLWQAHRMWDHLEQHADFRQDELREVLGGHQAHWRSIAETWEKMGLLRRIPEGGSYRLTLLTRLGQIVSGKCPVCGSVAEAPKAMFLEVTSCPKCQEPVHFVLLEDATGAVTKE